jgi:hypothetical protein
MGDEDLVQVALADNEPEAAMLCGLLESNGINAMYNSGGMPAAFGLFRLRQGALGQRQVLVRAGDVEKARTVLRETRSG